MESQKTVLMVRVDKIGDLVLSLPTDQVPLLKGMKVHWLIAKGTGFVAAHSDPPRAFHEIDKDPSEENFQSLVEWVKNLKPDISIVLYAPSWVSRALAKAKVPLRVGRRSQLKSWFHFNRGIRQSRKHGERHETDYNFEIVQRGLKGPWPTLFSKEAMAPLKLKAPAVDLVKWGLVNNSYFIVHPGMAGSALNWPSTHYDQLLRVLVASHPVVITGTAADQSHLMELAQKWKDHSGVHWLVDQLNSDELLGVLAGARAVIAPSTGILHLAASLGLPCVGLYSPIPVQRPKRWGPRGPRAVALMSPADPILAEKDPSSAMGKIKVVDVLAELRMLEVLE